MAYNYCFCEARRLEFVQYSRNEFREIRSTRMEGIQMHENSFIYHEMHSSETHTTKHPIYLQPYNHRLVPKADRYAYQLVGSASNNIFVVAITGCKEIVRIQFKATE